ncbi:MAG TPA: hypothetical protein VHF01_17895 [Candidatus Acidoferrum sp.]|nr:hypothetical protein [Candidatus Acidoferrum sp.]
MRRLAAIICLVGMAVALFVFSERGSVEAQLPSQIELACPAGTWPMSSGGQTVNASTGKYRQWACVDANGNVTHALAAGSTIGGLTPATLAVCTNFTPVTATNTIAATNLQSCTVPANTLATGSLLEINETGINGTGSAQTITITTNLGGGTSCSTVSGTTSVANQQPWNVVVKFFVLIAGVGGTANMSCELFSSAAGGGVVGPAGTVGNPTISVNTTISNTLQVTVTMSVANASNTVTEQGLKVAVF